MLRNRALQSMTLYIIDFLESATLKSKLERLRFALNGQRRLSATTGVGSCLITNHGRDINRSFRGIYKYRLQMIREDLLCSPFSNFSISSERQFDSSDNPPPEPQHR